MAKSVFGVEHPGLISKGSSKLGLRMIGAYGKKPKESMGAIKRSVVGGKNPKGMKNVGDQG